VSKNINAWWSTAPKPGNMGDIITPFIISSIFNITLKRVELNNNNHKKYKEILLSTGSIIQFATKNATVWGSGLIREVDYKKASKQARFLAVRGPISREILNDNGFKVPEVYGDPGLLVKHYFNPNPTKIYEYGIIPHYKDYDMIKEAYKDHKNIKVINVLNSDPRIPLMDISCCEKTVSSSLHGLIFSHAYNVPTTWVKFSTHLSGDDVKFRDYYAYCGLKLNKEEGMINIDDLSKLSFTLSNKSDKHLNPLLRSFTENFGISYNG